MYREDGTVEAFDGSEWWKVCTFTPEQVEQAKEALRTSGLMEADDLSDQGVQDAATLTYFWRIDGISGAAANLGHPVRTLEVVDALDERIHALEAAAGSGKGSA